MSDDPQVYAYQRQSAKLDQKPPEAKKKIKIPRITIPALPVLSKESLILAILGFVLSRAEVLGNLLPFGPAYFAALVYCDKKQVPIQSIPVAVGLMSILSGQELFSNIGVIAVLAVIFLFYSVDMHKQWVAVPAVVFTSIVVVKGITFAFGHASDYLVMVTIFESLFAAGLSLVFLVVGGAWRQGSFVEGLSADEMVCTFVMILVIIMGIGSWQIGYIDVQSVLSRLLIMVAAILGGSGAGAAFGALVGIVPSLSEMVAPSIIGMYAFSGLLAGAFNSFGRVGVVMGFFLGNLLLALYLLNTPLVIASLTTSAAAGCLLLLFPKKWLFKIGKIFNFNFDRSSRNRKDDMARVTTVQRLKSVGKVVGELACTLEQISSEAKEKEQQNINSVLNHISKRLCYECAVRKICWEKDFYQTYRAIMSLFAAAEANGAVNAKDIPVMLRKRCSHLKEMLATVNCLCELYQKNNYWQRQMDNTRSLVANQLSGIAEITDKLGQEIKNQGRSKELLETDLAKVLSKNNLPVDKATVLRMGEKVLDVTMELKSCPGIENCQDVLVPAISRLTGMTYEIHQSNCSIETGTKTCWFRFLPAGAKKLRLGKAQVAKDKEQVCGDSSGSILLQEGKKILMLSDGMGVGSKAAMESGTTLALLEQLLETGFNQQVALNTINSVLMLRSSDESFATVDLCIIDLYNDEADFVKIGGAPSFIKTKDEVKVVRASSLPIGLLHTVEMETIQERIKVGDIIVMATDGLIDTGLKMEDAEQWIIRVLEETTETDPQRLAEILIKRAIHIAGGKPRDDITIIVAMVEDDKN